VNQSLLGQSAPGDAGTTPPLPPGAGGSIAAHQIVGDQKDSVSGFAHQNSPGLNIANRTSASVLGVSSEHRSDSSHSGSRNISSVVKVLLGISNYSEEHSECSNASEEASNASDSVSESSGGQIADLLAIFDSKSAGLCFVDLMEYIRLRNYPTLIGHSLNCADTESGLIVVRALCLIAHYAHLKHLTDQQLRSCLQFVPPCVAATQGLNELTSAQTEAFNVLATQLVDPTSEQVLDAFTDATGDFLLSEMHHWGIPQQRVFEAMVSEGIRKFGIPLEFVLYTTVSTQLAHAGQSQFVGSPPESTQLTHQSPFGFNRRVLSSALTASNVKARASELDLQTSTDSGFAGSTSGGAKTAPLCITKLAPHLSGFGIRLSTTNYTDLLYQSLSVAAAFAAEPLFAEAGPSGGLPATTRLYLMKIDAVQQWILRLLFTLMTIIIEKGGGDSASNIIFRDTFLSPNGRAVSSVFQRMPPSVMTIVADRLNLDCQSGVYALTLLKEHLRSQTSHMGLVETQYFLALTYNDKLGAFAHAQRTREAQQHVAEVAVLGDARHPCANFAVGLWFFIASINLWLSKHPDAPQTSINGVKALNTAYANGSIGDWEQLYSLLGTMSTKGQLRGTPPKPRAFSPDVTDGRSGDLSGSVNAATVEWDYSAVPDKAAYIHGAGSILMQKIVEEDLKPFQYFERIGTQVKGQGGVLTYATRLKKDQDGNAPELPAEVMTSESLLRAYETCVRAIMPTLSGGVPNPKYNQAFATAPKAPSNGSRGGSRGGGGASGGKGGKGGGGKGKGKGGKGSGSFKEAAMVLAAAKVAEQEAEVEDRRVKKVEAAALKAEERAQDQVLRAEKQADARSKEIATALAAQEARTDAKILLIEKAHTDALAALNASHALTSQQLMPWGGGGNR
jgi:uncharacterized membrane protein YgcG